MKPYIELRQIHQEGHTLHYRFRSSLNIFRKDHFFIQYDSLPSYYNRSLQSLPFAALMQPVAWALGCNLILPFLDQTYLESLETLQTTIRQKYAAWSFEGTLFTKPIANQGLLNTRTGLLFSGSLDSMSAYMRHYHKNPKVFAILDSDGSFSDRVLVSFNKENLANLFSREMPADLSYIETDIRRVLETSKLKSLAKPWFENFSLGILLASLTAPASYSDLKTLILPGYSLPPFGWANTDVETDLNHHEPPPPREFLTWFRRVYRKYVFQ